MSKKKSLLQRLAEGIVIGDGSYIFTLERRGYVLAGAWTPEVVLENPDAVRQLHKEYLWAGADVLQTSTFFAQDGTLQSKFRGVDIAYTCKELNDAACSLVHEVAGEQTLICGSICETVIYKDINSKEAVQKEFRKQCQVFKENNVDFLLAEFFNSIIEMEWAIEIMKETGLTACASMKICTLGDIDKVTPQECAVRMCRAGADVVGVNCSFGPDIALKTLAMMKEGLENAGLKPYLMSQPLGYHTKELENNRIGYTELPEFPFALETRALNRIEAHQYARKAYELGVRYIGGCCGFEPHLIRAIAEELAPERGFRPPGKEKSSVWGSGLAKSHVESQNKRASKDYWLKIQPSTGK
ncbi:S-methylmethionine--homocysteine S-methyltransferase BHMT2-like [Anneissia japonica]|uniref:S-methylmethionine--homocysteine S-methyltransferase BHMT2-like n=1 Tax=Anneissia japonica TaxID=1529436 RepID=UPI001425863F|nr:S-methylmethionine--homocysteine S-methyltransferase BHMT2-like [Anneissia japonica]